MRNRMIVTALLTVTVAVIALATTARTQDKLQKDAKAFMRIKLNHSQKVLEGLTTEEFGMVARSAQELSLLSLAAQWQVIQTPEYVRRSAEFRREVEGLREAADQKNLDGATLAYLRVTMQCIECHKYVRSVAQVRLEDAPAGVPQREVGLRLR